MLTHFYSDKKSATTFQVRYRSQNDPLINDAEATDFVLTAVDAPNTKTSAAPAHNPKVKSSTELASELGLDASTLRSNEGEAAMYGIYYDDTKYDYMQHMREPGSIEAVFIEAPQADTKQRKDRHKGKMVSLDEAIRAAEEPKSTVVRLPRELLASDIEVRRTYQDQQDIPDALAGFQPDMDPRLREVLEALDDDAYVDDDEDIFSELAKAGETSEDAFLDAVFDDEEEDDGWGSDTTEKAAATAAAAVVPVVPAVPATEEEGNSEVWMREFSKFKKSQKKVKKVDDDTASSLAGTMSFGGSTTGSTMSISGKRRRRREKVAGTTGARTASSGYSMSSSALFRTEGLTLLDDRFDRVCPRYNHPPHSQANPDRLRRSTWRMRTRTRR